MKFSILFFLLFTYVFSGEIIIHNVEINQKKQRFYKLLVPVVQKVYAELSLQYQKVLKDIKTKQNTQEIEKLKKIYKVKTDRELLLALKPHPKSIVLAQAAIESGWATSRFFNEANNVFGVWSTKKNQPRIAAKEKRDAKRTIWLKKFDSIEDSVRDYYKMIATVGAYKEFRKIRYSSSSVLKMINKLDKYSELDKKYTKDLGKIIKYNNLIKYDK